MRKGQGSIPYKNQKIGIIFLSVIFIFDLRIYSEHFSIIIGVMDVWLANIYPKEKLSATSRALIAHVM